MLTAVIDIAVINTTKDTSAFTNDTVNMADITIYLQNDGNTNLVFHNKRRSQAYSRKASLRLLSYTIYQRGPDFLIHGLLTRLRIREPTKPLRNHDLLYRPITIQRKS